MVITMPARHASAGDDATIAPSARNASAFDRVRLDTVTRCPARKRLFAIPVPIPPRPIRPTSMVGSASFEFHSVFWAGEGSSGAPVAGALLPMDQTASLTRSPSRFIWSIKRRAQINSAANRLSPRKITSHPGQKKRESGDDAEGTADLFDGADDHEGRFRSSMRGRRRLNIRACIDLEG